MGGFFWCSIKTRLCTGTFLRRWITTPIWEPDGAVWRPHGEEGFNRAIHNIENSPFRTKFDHDVGGNEGQSGIGCISDFEPQPLLIQSHLGSFAITTVGKVNNYDELLKQLYEGEHSHFQEMTSGTGQCDGTDRRPDLREADDRRRDPLCPGDCRRIGDPACDDRGRDLCGEG